MNDVKCLICGREVTVLPFGGYQYQDRIYSLCECPSCGLRFIFPLPTPEETKDTYNNLKYWQSGDFAGDATNYDYYKNQYKKDAIKIKNLINKYHIHKGNFLEIGCAQGDLLKELQPFFGEVTGLDVSEPMIKLARGKGLNVNLGRIEDAKFNDKFDCIYLGDLIEHLANPIIFLQQLSGLVEENGIVIIEIPLTYNIYPINIFLSPFVFLKNIFRGRVLNKFYLNFFSNIQRRKNVKIDHFPYHLIEFTPKSARNMMNLAGWQVIHDHVYCGWPKRKYFKSKNFCFIILRVLSYFITKYNSFFDLGDRMTIAIKQPKQTL